MNSKHPSLERLALLAQGRPNLLAGPLALYSEQEGLDDQQLAAKLGCDIEALPKLALCERPRPAPHFRQDVERIASYIGADAIQLALLIRAAESREALSSRQNATLPALLAARDYEDDNEEDEAGPGDE
ncbi:MAG TPA: hypothetical protein VFA09_12495 [Ktedonobacteraceae bacterium]|jgi:hypothetical protein|nr:hypothetical protein [Ktedonobacteraceae bacterium]